MIIDCISDLHGHKPKLEGGDLLIVAGDVVEKSLEQDYEEFFVWLRCQNYFKKIVIAGNHDTLLDSGISFHLLTLISSTCTYLMDEGTQFKGLEIWGSPWTAKFNGINPSCTAFTVENDTELHKKWREIPFGVDILITHCPPYYILDEVFNPYERIFINTGSPTLSAELIRINPKMHVFGHIHQHGGKRMEMNGITYVNASIMDECYDPTHPVVRIEL